MECDGSASLRLFASAFNLRWAAGAGGDDRMTPFEERVSRNEETVASQGAREAGTRVAVPQLLEAVRGDEGLQDKLGIGQQGQLLFT